MPDTDLAEKLGRGSMGVFHKRSQMGVAKFEVGRWTPESLAMLGTMPDSEVAKIVGLQQPAVSRKRRNMGIGSYLQRKTAHVDWDSLPLGQDTDLAIAERLGVSEPVVKRARNARGIAPSRVIVEITNDAWEAAGLGTRSDGRSPRISGSARRL